MSPHATQAPAGGRSVVDRDKHRLGFDVLRLVALGFVFTHHALTLTDHAEWSAVGGYTLGRLGTAIFFVLSGYVAATTARPPGAWLAQRIGRIVPAYWLVTAASFVLAGWTGYKAFDWEQVVCQMAGIGLFTHPGRMVNTVTWFVSLLLALYLLTAVARQVHRAGVTALLIAAAGGLALWEQAWYGIFFCHALSFFLAFAAAAGRGSPTTRLTVAAGAAAALVPIQPDLEYGAAALTLLTSAVGWPGQWRAGRWLSLYTYEWFLVHGLCLHAACRLVGKNVWLVVPVAAITGFAVAIILHHLTRSAGAWVKVRLGGSPPAGGDRRSDHHGSGLERATAGEADPRSPVMGSRV